MKKYYFSIANNDLICVGIDNQIVEFKVGEIFGFENPSMEIEDDVVFLNQIHETTLITQEMLVAAQKWWNNYITKEENKDFLKSLEPSDSRLDFAEIDSLNNKVSSLQRQLAEALDEIAWWKKKYKEDCQEIRLVGRREGEKDMKEKCRKVCLDIARSESYYSDNVADECAQEIDKLEISRSLDK